MEPSADEIRLQLDRVLASDVFASADRMSGFLRYIVERAMAGESDQVKEYTIGVAVFGRNEQYDPRLDSIVRVEARRLRTKLNEYYSRTGREDPIVIEMPRGAYVPTFDRRAVPAPASAPPPAIDRTPSRAHRKPLRAAIVVALLALPLAIAAWRTGLWVPVGRATPMVTIAVLPFAEYSGDARNALLAARLTDGVTGELARIRTLGVASHTSALQFGGVRRPVREMAQALNVELVLEGSVHPEGEGVRVEARLVDALADRKIWVADFIGRRSELGELQRRVAAAAGAAAERSRNR